MDLSGWDGDLRLRQDGVSKRYSGRSTRSSGGLGVLPFVLLAILAFAVWNLHGGHMPSLRSVQAILP